MRKVLAIGIASALGFFAGKQLQEYEKKEQDALEQQRITNKNFHSASTVVPPFRRITYPHFSILYSTYHRSPLAVHEILTKSLSEGDAPRNKFFFPEETIPEKHLQVDQSFYGETEAFARFNLNRGHMAAAGNYSGSEAEKFSTFSFANVLPQNGYNNGGIWNTFERYTRKLVEGPLCESVEVISGPIYLKETPGGQTGGKAHQEKLVVLRENGIPIPEKLYKIIKCNSHEGKAYVSAFTFLNSETYDNFRKLFEFTTPLNEVERQTGLRFDLKGGQLSEIDSAGLGATKKDLDYDFYFGLMTNSTTIKEMQQNYRRAREQKIDIDFSRLTDKILTMARKESAEIEGEKILQCDRLGRWLRLKKKLYQLNHKEQTRELWEEKVKQAYQQCLSHQSRKEEQDQFERLKRQIGEDISKLIK